MNDNSTKIWKWLVIVLVAVNLALLATIWFKPRHPHGPPPMGHMPPPHGGPREMIIHELNFNEAQVKEFEGLITEHRAAIERLRNEGKDLRTSLFDQLKNDLTDSLKVKEATNAIAKNQIYIEMATFDHFEKVRKLCNPEQKKKFDGIINNITKMMGGMGPPPPHGPPH